MSFDPPPNDPNQPTPEGVSPQQYQPDGQPSPPQYSLEGQPGMQWQQPVSGQPFAPGPVVPPEADGKLKTVWTHPAVIVGTVGIIVLLIVAVTILALRPGTSPAGEDGTENDKADAGESTSEEDRDEAGTGDNGAEESEAPEGDETYFTGKLSICASCDGTNPIDFDTGKSDPGGYGAYTDDPKPFDADVTENGLKMLTKEKFGEWEHTEAPTGAADCEGVADGKRSEDVHLSRLKQLSTFCFTTAEGRSGYFVVNKVELAETGSLDDLDIQFTVWKGEDDL